ncbi:hypothetical protein P8452_13233 [Trifolium repens]|nr:hypothetical protein P8452_13233 [Trifolium repens]
MASTSRRLPTPAEREKWKHIFDTTIDPNLVPIEIPQPFFNKMKSEFINHTFGWIRGPKKMKFMVRYLQSNSGIKLSSGVCVSRYFGFAVPTRVTLSYVIDENTFWMRIYPPLQPVKTEFPPEETLKRKHQNDDQDEPNSKRCKRPKANKQAVYLKSPPPCQNSKNNDDQDEPNSKRCKKPRGNKQAVSLKSPPPCKKQKILKSTPKELSKQRHPNLKIRPSERKKYLKSTPKKSNKQHQSKHSRKPVIVKLNPDGSYSWEKIVTTAAAADARPQVMHFPKQLSTLFLGEKQNKMLVKAGAGDTFSCKLITAGRNAAEKYISKEWSKFVRRNNLQAGDKLIFTLQNPPTKLLIQIIRCSAHD